MGLGVAHPEPPARSSGPACCPRLGFLRGGGPPSICPSAHRPLHAPLGWTVKWGAAGATVGVSPFTDGSPKLLLGTISWHSWVPAGIVVLVQPAAVGWSRQRHAPGLPAGRRVARGSCSGSCPLAPWVQPPTALLTGGPAGAELPMGPPAAGPPQLPPHAGVAGRLPQWCWARQTGFMASREKLLGKRLSKSIDRAAPLPPHCCLPFPHRTLHPILAQAGAPRPHGGQWGLGPQWCLEAAWCRGGHALWEAPHVGVLGRLSLVGPLQVGVIPSGGDCSQETPMQDAGSSHVLRDTHVGMLGGNIPQRASMWGCQG